ncbi:MAG: hypothetical protein JRJ23_07775 [Deltaproteobacteria bacterium]|nr:hypothetical protein [Deltaproteobacteria bacterium]MBW1914673.1 hypothetical protein [Deltaproteobacteria bacterium]
MERIFARFIIFAMLFFSCSTPLFCEEGTIPEKSFDDYMVLVNQNVFSRSRGHIEVVKKKIVIPAASPESYFVLRGVTQQGKEFVAFFEDTRTTDTVQVHTGDKISRGRLTEIKLDFVEFQMDESRSRIRIGMNLEGVLSASVKPPEKTPASLSEPGRSRRGSDNGFSRRSMGKGRRGGIPEAILESILSGLPDRSGNNDGNTSSGDRGTRQRGGNKSSGKGRR